MSLIFERFLNFEPHQVEVTREGELIFLDYDINFDVAALEFGYPQTDATKLKREWDEEVIGTLIFEVVGDRIERKHMARLALEYAERALDVENRSQLKGKRARILFDASQEYLFGNIDRESFRSLRKKRSNLEDAKVGKAMSGSAASVIKSRMSVYAASGAVFHHDTNKADLNQFLGAVSRAADYATSAVAIDFCESRGQPHYVISKKSLAIGGKQWNLRKRTDLFISAKKAEEAWQLRRFVDCIEAVSQGFDWPDISVTP